MALFGLACLVAAPHAGASQLAQTATTQPSISEATSHNAGGLLKARNRDFDGAINDYSEAIRLDPMFADAFYNRGAAKAAKGDVDEAIEDYSRAIAIDPRHSRAYFSRGRVREEARLRSRH
jgi:tetratricopeptide (TPR) repeat protein